MRFSLIIVLLALFANNIFAQNTKNLSCTAELTVDPIIQEKEIIHHVFIGNDTTGLNLVLKKIIIKEGKYDWVNKKKIDCHSINAADCIEKVWEYIPPVSMNLYVLQDIEASDEYEIKKEKVQYLVREGSTKLYQVLCDKNRTPTMIKKIQKALIEKGYPLQPNGILDQATNLAITDFQRTQFMAYGDISLELLASLNIK